MHGNQWNGKSFMVKIEIRNPILLSECFTPIFKVPQVMTMPDNAEWVSLIEANDNLRLMFECIELNFSYRNVWFFKHDWLGYFSALKSSSRKNTIISRIALLCLELS